MFVIESEKKHAVSLVQRLWLQQPKQLSLIPQASAPAVQRLGGPLVPCSSAVSQQSSIFAAVFGAIKVPQAASSIYKPMHK